MSTAKEIDTAEYPVTSAGRADRPRFCSALAQVDVWGLSDAGKVRPNNEDHFLIGCYGRFLEVVQTNLASRDVRPRSEETGYGMLVADGMGGHAGGEEASKLAIATLVDLVLLTPDWILLLDDEASAREVMLRAKDRFAHINATLAERARAEPALRGLGTTLTVAWSLGKDLFVAGIGDSRAYLLRRGVLRRLTRDHTLAQQLADQGRIAPEEVATHRLRHVLTSALGFEGRPVEPEVHKLLLEDEDRLLLCTDGLTEMVGDAEIAAVLAGDKPSNEVCRLLIDKALEAGGKDNVTVVVARYRLPAV